MTKYKHQSVQVAGSSLREVVFGLEDGMVSTLGAVTGIAIGSEDHYTVILAGLVIIAVESISMGIGSYLSNRSQQDLNRQVLKEEHEEITDYPVEERSELKSMFRRDGWSESLAEQMSAEASRNNTLMLKEMAYRELNIVGSEHIKPWSNGLKMFFSYVIGGMIPLVAYFLIGVSQAMPISIIVTLIGLFVLGAVTTKFTKVSWYRAGLRIMLLGGLAMAVGLIVGDLVRVS